MDDIEKAPFEECLKSLPPTRQELGAPWSAAIGRSGATVKRALQALARAQTIRRVGANKKGVWIVNEK